MQRWKGPLAASIVSLLIAGLIPKNWGRAQAPQVIAPKDVPPYEFYQFSVAMQLSNGQLYKAVYQGCELYIAVVGKNGQSPTVSITTGRGCK